MNQWDDEPNELDWADEKTGFQCRIIRVRDSGHLCGYVRIPDGHPLHGVEYSAEMPEALKPLKDAVMECPVGKRGAIDVLCMAFGSAFRPGQLFDVHGSVTFSGELRNQTGFWYGFDCAHAGDLCPAMEARYGRDWDSVYRDMEFVKAECESLANQIAQVAA